MTVIFKYHNVLHVTLRFESDETNLQSARKEIASLCTIVDQKDTELRCLIKELEEAKVFG